MDELGCIVNMFVLPIGIATALLFSKDPGRKKIGWCMVLCMAVFGFMVSIGSSGETSIVVVGIIIGIMIVSSSVNSSQNSNLQKSVSKETTSQNTNVSLESNRKNNLDNAEKKVNYQKSIQENSTDEKELSKNKSVIQGNYPSDTIFDENLVLLETNGKRVYQKISSKKEATVFTEFEHTEKNIKNDDSMISASLPRVYYSSVLDAVHKNHVPESYCKIIIEQIRNTNVKECPGIAWKDSERFYILPLIVGYPIYSWPTDQVYDI